MERLDFVIFGATGFTGKCLLREAVAEGGFKWGIAGRDETKLRDDLKCIGNETGADVSAVIVILADVTDATSLSAMTSKSRVVINCVGPYRTLGEPVVRACVATGTHYVDVAAEIQFMQQMQLKYGKIAEEAGVYVVYACGLDCVPTDMGVVFLQKHFNGTLNSVESFMTIEFPPGCLKPGTPMVNYRSMESLVHSVGRSRERSMLRRQIGEVPDMAPKLRKRCPLYKNFQNYFLSSDLADDEVVRTTQKFFYEKTQQRPVQFKSYIGIPNIFAAIAVVLVLCFAYLMFPFEITRKMMLKGYKVFSLGYVSKKGVEKKIMDNMKFNCYLKGRGWDTTVENLNDAPPKKTFLAKISGMNPGYAFTAVAALKAAITILKEEDRMPERGGVLTPGIAFSNTSYIQALCERGYPFEILEGDVETMPEKLVCNIKNSTHVVST